MIKNRNDAINTVKDNKDKTTIFKFGAPWCGPCKKVKPAYEKYKEDNKDNLYFEIDVDDDDTFMDLMSEWGLKKIPHFIVFKNGIKQGSFQTSNDEDMKSSFNSIINDDF